MLYLDLQKQKRTTEPNEFTIPIDSEEAKAFFTSKQPNQDLIIDLVNKITYFKEYQLQADGTRYSHYLEDGTPDLVAIQADEDARLLEEAKATQQTTLDTLTVTTTAGNTFDANNQARLDMQNAITASDYLLIIETVWRLADDSEVLIQLDELKEALALAIQEYARVKSIGV